MIADPPQAPSNPDAEALQRLLERVPGVLFQLEVEPDGRMRFPVVTAPAARACDIDVATLVSDGRALWPSVHHADRDGVLRAVQASIDTLEDVDHTFRLGCEQGTRWVRAVARPEERVDGGITFYGVVTDVTRAAEQRDSLQDETDLRGALVALTNELLERDLDERFFQHVLERAIALVPGSNAGSVMVLDGDAFRFAAAVGFDLEGLKSVRIPRGGMTVGTGAAPRVVDYAGANLIGDDHVGTLLRRYGRLDEIRSTVAVPVVIDAQPVAYLNLDSFSSRDAFGSRALEVTGALAVQVAVAMQRLALEQRLVHVATHDELTGLPNRRYLQDRLAQAVAAAQRHARHIALLMLDLDGFKPINDRLGHHTGDAVLAQIARRLRDALRAEDTVARFGGDEFVVLLEHPVAPAHAVSVAQKLVEVLSRPIGVNGHTLELGASVGVALFPDHAADPERLLQAADDAMFAAKAAGRGRVRTARTT